MQLFKYFVECGMFLPTSPGPTFTASFATCLSAGTLNSSSQINPAHLQPWASGEGTKGRACHTCGHPSLQRSEHSNKSSTRGCGNRERGPLLAVISTLRLSRGKADITGTPLAVSLWAVLSLSRNSMEDETGIDCQVF